MKPIVRKTKRVKRNSLQRRLKWNLKFKILENVYSISIKVVTMHRCIAILGPPIRVLYRDVSIAIRITIRIKYRDPCIAISGPYHDATSGRITLCQRCGDNACVAIRVSIPPPAARRSI